MAGRHAVIGSVLAKSRIGRDVVGTDRAVTLKGRPEHSRVAWVEELGKGFPRRAGESMEEIRFSALIHHVVEEGTEFSTAQLYSRVGRGLHEPVETQLARQH